MSRRCKLVPLLGNHDPRLLDVRSGKYPIYWPLDIGGTATLDTYGPGRDLARIPDDHSEFLEGCRPSGHGLFGGLAGFRDNKAGYKVVQSERDLFGIWGTTTEFVQEIDLCPEFERRIPGTGYRGEARTTSVLRPGLGGSHAVTLSGTNPLRGLALAMGGNRAWNSISCSTGRPSRKPRTQSGP
jgi:hypothetical protein